MTFFGAYEPAGLMYVARGIASGGLAWNESVAKYLYSCTLCGYCEDLCSRGYRHTPVVAILEELRRIIPEELKPKALKKAADSIQVPEGNMLFLLKKYGLSDLSEGSKAERIIFGDRSLISNASKLEEISFLIKKSGKTIGWVAGTRSRQLMQSF